MFRAHRDGRTPQLAHSSLLCLPLVATPSRPYGFTYHLDRSAKGKHLADFEPLAASDADAATAAASSRQLATVPSHGHVSTRAAADG